MIVPNANSAVADLQKLTEYCLNPEHPRGKHKAFMFASALGITLEHAEILQKALLEAVRTHEAVPGEVDNYGQRYTVDFEMTTPAGKAEIRSAWIIRRNEDIPRLVSAYVIGER